jgi:serpin B
LQKNVKFNSDFENNAAKNFYASLFNVNFADEKTANLMSNWISENTNNVLTPDIDLDKEQIISIINTIYFKDEWVNRFSEEATKLDYFYLNDGSEIKCDFMNMSYGSHEFNKGDGFTSSSLSLKGSGNMIFILPDKGVSIDDLLSTPEKAASLFDAENNQSGKVIFQIPKFSFGNELDLNDTLKTMGVKSAFNPDADFTGMTDNMAFISNIKQQTHIAIDEKGVEAAAFTQIDYCGSAPSKEILAEMILDRPFIFAITSDNGTILFIGIVNNPDAI